jgi:hypothetical protein
MNIKHLLSVIFIISGINLSAQFPEMSSLGPMYTYGWDTIKLYDTDGLIERYSQTYNLQGKVTMQFHEDWGTNPWNISIRKSYTYDESGNLGTTLTQKVFPDSIVNAVLSLYEYNSNKQLLSHQIQEWKFNTTWANFLRFEYVYSNSGKLAEYTENQWFGAWKPNYKKVFTYDSMDSLKSMVSQIASGTEMLDNQRETYTRNAQGKLTSLLFEEFSNNAWRLSIKTDFTYQNDGKISTRTESQSYDGVTMVELLKYTYTWDAVGNLTSIKEAEKHEDQWVDYFVTTRSYDADRNLVQTIREKKKDADWTNYDRCTYVSDSNKSTVEGKHDPFVLLTAYRYEAKYSYIDLGIGENKKESFFAVYPNPATSLVTISGTGNRLITGVKLLDTHGRIALSKVVNERGRVQLNVNSLSPGIYIMQIESQGRIENKKLVISNKI